MLSNLEQVIWVAICSDPTSRKASRVNGTVQLSYHSRQASFRSMGLISV